MGMNKYKVIAIAYRNIEKSVEDRICKFSIKDVFSMDDLENVSEFCGRGFNMNNRVCIYMDWFRDDFKSKIKEGYKISLLEMPHKEGSHRLEFLELLDSEYGEELLVLGKVDV